MTRIGSSKGRRTGRRDRRRSISDPVDTSRAAYEATSKRRATNRARIENHVRSRGRHGATNRQVSDALGIEHSMVASHMSALRDAGHVVNSLERRRNRSGQWAIVWVVPEFASAEALAAARTSSVQLRRQSLRAENKVLRERIAELEAEVVSLQDDNDALRVKVKDLQVNLRLYRRKSPRRKVRRQARPQP